MSREEIKALLISIKSFYPRFSLVETGDNNELAVRSQTLDAWYDLIGYKTKDECMKILEDHLAGPNGDKTPTAGIFTQKKRSGDVLTGTAYRNRYEVIYQPDPAKEPQRLAVHWTGSAWIDVEGRMWAEPNETHPELVVSDFKWEGEGEFADRIRDAIWPYTDKEILQKVDQEVDSWQEFEKRLMGG